MSSAARLGLKHSQPMCPLGCATAKNHRPFAQWNLSLAHLQHLKFAIVISHRLKRFIGCTSAWLRNCMRTKTNICSVQIFLERTLLATC